jgi:hypothetical protein
VKSIGAGDKTEWKFLQENLPLSSLTIYEDKLLARFFNPTGVDMQLLREYPETTVWGSPIGSTNIASAKSILTLQIAQKLPTLGPVPVRQVDCMSFPEWRVGDNCGLPDPEIIEQFKEKIAVLDLQLAQVEKQLKDAIEKERLSLQHQYYVIKREMYELRLSALLNERKLSQQGKADYDYLYAVDPEIAELGKQLNDLRIKRRIFDYVTDMI